jgi:hypothetical protein
MFKIMNCALLLLCAFAAASCAAAEEARDTPAKPAHRLVVYYLHNTWRCPGCNSVESLSKAAILGGRGENTKANTEIDVESPFREEVNSGLLSFESVNIDLKENKALLETLEGNLKIPVVAEVKDENIIAFTPLKEAWSHLGDNKAFVQYVREGTAPVVKKLRAASETGDGE